MNPFAVFASAVTLTFSLSALGAKSADFPIVVNDSTSMIMAPVPLHFTGTSYLQIDGIGNLAATQKLLAPYGYYAVVAGPGLAAWSIFAARHVKSNVPNHKGGAYNEVFITVAASRAPDTSAALFSNVFDLRRIPTEFGYFVVKIWVDDEAAKAIGNEVWGFNKDMAAIHINANPQKKAMGFRLMDPVTGANLISLSTETPSTARPADLNFYILTRFKKASAIFTGNGKATMTDITALTPALPPGDRSIQPSFSTQGWGAVMANEIQFKATRKSLISNENLDVGLPEND